MKSKRKKTFGTNLAQFVQTTGVVCPLFFLFRPLLRLFDGIVVLWGF